MSWKAPVGRALGSIVQRAAKWSSFVSRGLAESERRVLELIFGRSLALDRIELRESLSGLINLSGRAFVIENSVHLPLPPGHAPMHLLVHEATHVWQFQNGGHAYIADSVWAQTFGDGYQLEKGLLQGRTWSELNCEQQATLVEHGWLQGCFNDDRPFVLRGREWTERFREAKAALVAGAGASFTSSGETLDR